MKRAVWILAVSAAAAGCKPGLGLPASLITGPRVLAVIADPPEVAPGGRVSFRALAATPAGTDANPSLGWAFCAAPKPPVSNNVISDDCLRDAIRPISSGASNLVTAVVPADACLLFGPDTPPQQPGQPPFRPRDPDFTGGYYQPVRVSYVSPEVAVELERVSCALVNASPEAISEFRARYRPNLNPRLTAVSALLNGQPLSFNQIPAGARVTFRADWTPESAEIYALFDPVTQQVVDHRESLRVSWFASDGSFEQDRTGRGEGEFETSSDNFWHAPSSPGSVHLWVVLRDIRGGMDFATAELSVR